MEYNEEEEQQFNINKKCKTCKKFKNQLKTSNKKVTKAYERIAELNTQIKENDYTINEKNYIINEKNYIIKENKKNYFLNGIILTLGICITIGAGINLLKTSVNYLHIDKVNCLLTNKNTYIEPGNIIKYYIVYEYSEATNLDNKVELQKTYYNYYELTNNYNKNIVNTTIETCYKYNDNSIKIEISKLQGLWFVISISLGLSLTILPLLLITVCFNDFHGFLNYLNLN